jgi:hypothetical protein
MKSDCIHVSKIVINYERTLTAKLHTRTDLHIFLPYNKFILSKEISKVFLIRMAGEIMTGKWIPAYQRDHL